MSMQYVRYPAIGGGSEGVTSLNALTGALSLIAGTNITITPSGSTIEISSTGSGTPGGTNDQVQFNNGGVFGGFGNWNGTTLSVNAFTVTAGPSSFTGNLGFFGATPVAQQTGNIFTALTNLGLVTSPSLASANIPNNAANTTGTASNITATSNSTLTTLSSLSLPYSQVTGAPAAITALTGDATATGPGSVGLTLATVNSNVGSFGSSTSIPSFTVNGKGLITAASGNVVIAPAGTLSGTTLNATVLSSSLTSVGTITTGVWNGTPIAIANGGTGQTSASTAFNALSPLNTKGDLLVYSTTNTREPVGTDTFVLTADSTQTTGVKWAPAAVTFTAPNVQALTSTASSTYTTPANALYLKVQMIGAGGGGGGSGVSGATAGSTGGDTTFGAQLDAGGGAGGPTGSGAGGAGGSATLGVGPVGAALVGGQGGGGAATGNGGIFLDGGQGGTGYFGGGGGAGQGNGSGGDASTNTGAGGGGGGTTNSLTNINCGSGGGSGGFVEAYLFTPSATYTYQVGAAGTGGNAGSNGFAGGNGADGFIIVTAYFQ